MMSLKRKRNVWAPATATLIVAAGGGFAIAQAATPAETIKVRQQGLKDLGAAVKLIRDELKTSSPDAAKIKTASAEITKAAAAIPDWFPAGTDASVGVKTAAKPEIWSDTAGFKSAQDAFIERAGKFVPIAESGDVAAVAAAFKPLGQSCAGCHDKYRVKQD
jgi:cytochrome c556